MSNKEKKDQIKKLLSKIKYLYLLLLIPILIISYILISFFISIYNSRNYKKENRNILSKLYITIIKISLLLLICYWIYVLFSHLLKSINNFFKCPKNSKILSFNFYNKNKKEMELQLINYCIHVYYLFCHENELNKKIKKSIDNKSWVPKNMKLEILLDNCFVLSKKQKGKTNIIIVFRGTSSLLDIISDFNAKLEYSSTFESKIHKGFLSIYEDERNQILEIIKKYKDIGKIMITGHSLGASIGILCYLDLYKNKDLNYINKDNIYAKVFASPKIGNLTFIKQFSNNIIKNLEIIINKYDIVPMGPPGSKTNIFKPLNKASIVYCNDKGYWIGNHSLLNYKEIINNKNKYKC